MDLPQKPRLVTATDLAQRPGEIISQVHYGKEPVVVTRRGRPMVMLIPLDPHANSISVEYRDILTSGEEGERMDEEGRILDGS